MYRIRNLSLAFMLGLFVANCGDGKPSQDHDGTGNELGEIDIHASMDPEEPTQLGPNCLTVTLLLDGNPFEGAEVIAVATMPGHGAHGTNEVPVVTEQMDGVYEVTNLVFTMPGTWQIELFVSDSEGQEYTERFEYTVR